MVFFNKALASFALIGAGSLISVEAIPAYPKEFTLEGGPTLKITGGPWDNRLVDPRNGYTVVEESPNVFKYATTDSLGYLVPSEFDLNTDPVAEPSLVPGLLGRLDDVQQEANKDLMTGDPGGFRRRLDGEPQTLNNFVLRLKFKNHQTRTYPPDADYDELFNKVTTPQNACSRPSCVTPTGSVKDFYFENSYGQMTLESTISPWQVTAQDESYYGAGCSSTCNEITRLHAAVKAALKDIDDAGFDWSPFDDGTGNIQMFSIVHSGYGAEYGQPDSYGTPHTDRIWSHKYYLSSSPTGNGYITRTGLRINAYHINPGLWDTSGSEAPHIGVISHESGHFLGLPDLYDTDSSSSGIGSFGLMANSWGFDGDQDNFPHMSAWAKQFVGFVDPVTLTQSQTVEVPEVHSNPAVYKITHGFPSNEYILIENRQAVSFDSNMPQGGMLVWHIDENKAGNSNKNNANEGYPGKNDWPGVHYHVALLQADGLYELEKARERGDAGDVYTPGQSISDTTVPSINAYSKKGCQTATTGLSGNKLEFLSVNPSTLAFTMRYTKTAACGCGVTCSTETDAPVTDAPTDGPTDAPVCQDDPAGWFDADGAQYNCEWYAVGNRCAQYGDQFENQGKTANEACCACGGGSDLQTEPPTTEEVCTDTPEGWFDADGAQYNCAWYAVGNRCAQYGDSFENQGTTANQACCACGGGSTGSNINRAPGAGDVVTEKDPADVIPTSAVGGAAIGAALVGGIAMGAIVGGVGTKKYMDGNMAAAEEAAIAQTQRIVSGNPVYENNFEKV